jgi:uncharacterized protein with GYD domain
MPKYAFLGGYSTASWKGMIDNPEARRTAVEKAAQVVGAKIESFYLSFGEDDFLLILEAPDDDAAAAISIATGSTGALRGIRTIKLIEADKAVDILGKARTVLNAYVPPGARQPAGVG